MATLFKPTYPKAIPPGAEIFTRDGRPFARFKAKRETITAPVTKDGQRILIENECWYVRYRDHKGNPQKLKGYSDRRATEELARKLDKLVARVSVKDPIGAELRDWIATVDAATREHLLKVELIDPKRHAAGKPLESHLEDFEKSLWADEDCEKHIRQVLAKLRRVFTACAFVQWGDISEEAVKNYLAECRHAKSRKEGKISTQTSNHYMAALRQFCNWMVNSKRATESPLGEVVPIDVKRERERRPLLPVELQALLATTERGPDRYGMSGPERALLYVLAAETGFRARSLRSLTRSSFDLVAEPATVRVRATNTKSKKTVTLPLRKATAAALRLHLAGKMPAALAFPMPSSDKTAKMLKADLDDARAEWIKTARTPDERAAREGSDFLCYVNHAGHVADFHALRGTCGTNLQRAGAPLTMAQKILQHSTPELTANMYTQYQLEEQALAMEALPSLAEGLQSFALPPSGALAATGTDDAIPADVRSEGPRMLRACHENAPKGQNEAQSGTEPEGQEKGNRLPQVLMQQAETLTGKADGRGFEPPGPLRAQQFSRLPP